MRPSCSQKKSTPANRRGISPVEFAGCFVALCGGIVLGSMYLGVDVQSLAVKALDKADIEVPEFLGGEASENSQTACGKNPEECELAAAAESDNDEQITELSTTETVSELATEETPAEEVVAEPVERRELSETERQTATKTYWETLDACLKAEINNRSRAITDPGNWQLFDYLLHRKKGHEKALATIQELDGYGVDQRVVTHAREVLAWQKTGMILFDRATVLLTDAPAGKLTGPFAQSWQSSATQHRMEEKLLLGKHAAVASYMKHSLKAAKTGSSEQ